MGPKIIDCEIVYSGCLTVEKLRVQVADGAIPSREIERHGDAAAVLPYDIERRCALVARIWSSPGVSMERQSLFLATYVLGDRTAVGGGVVGEHECITVVERPLSEILHDIEQGSVTDGKLVTLMFALRLRRPELFQ